MTFQQNRPLLRFAFFLILLVGSGCSASQEKQMDLEPGNDPVTIQGNYTPIPCFRTDAKIETDGGSRSQTFNARLLTDNTNQRLKITISEPFLGIVVSEVTVAGDRVFVDETGGTERVYSIEKYKMEGFGGENLKLPFPLVWKLLTGGLPDPIMEDRIQPQVRVKGELVYSIPDETGTGEYFFEKGYMTHLDYRQTGGEGAFRATASGERLEGSTFPESLTIQSTESSGNFTIHYQSIKNPADCRDRQFWMPPPVP